jgi:phage I-like protein
MNIASMRDRQHSLDELALELMGVLRSLHETYGQVLEVVAQQRRAVSMADAERLKRALGAMLPLESSIRELDERRRQVLARACPESTATVSVTEFAEQLSPEPAQRLKSQALALRARLDEVRREQGVLRSAVSSVLSHMDGMWQQIGQSLDLTGTYQPGKSSMRPGQGPISVDVLS